MLADRREYDVVIMGGGLAGLTLALQILQRRPETSVLVAERAEHPVPQAAHKVGEATVEVSAHYYGHVLGLSEHMESQQLRKMALRFYPAAGLPRPPLAERTELGPRDYLALPTWQIDRGRFENALGELVRDAGGEFISGCRVEQFELDRGGHAVTISSGEQRDTVRARWAVDASGRRGLIKNKLKLAEPVGHDCNAIWFRLGETISMDRLIDEQERAPSEADAAEWAERVPNGERWRATNHLMGRGYWAWLIPLASGSISVGLVCDPRYVPFEEINTFDGFQAWAERHEPELARAVAQRRDSLQDFRILRHFAHGCRQVFSADRWALTGEAGVFTDPLYSPGGDFIAYANTYITELVTRDLAGEPIEDFAVRADAVYRFVFRSFLPVWEGQYRIMGNPQVWSAKCVWDTLAYFAIINAIYHNGRITDLDFLQSVAGELFTFSVLNHRMQMFFRAWDRLDESGDQRYFFDLSSRLFYDLNASLKTLLEPAELRVRLQDNLELLQALAQLMMAGASKRIGIEVDARAIEPTSFTLGACPPAHAPAMNGSTPDARRARAFARAQAALEGFWHEPPSGMPAPAAPRPAPVARLGRRLAQAAVEAGARLLARAPAGLLRLAVREPLRRLFVPLLFRGMVASIDRTRLDGLEAVIDWEIVGSIDGAARSNGAGRAHANGSEPDRWQLVIDGGHASAGRQREREAELTMRLEALDLLKLATGLAAGPDLLIEGRLRAEGDLMLGPRFLDVVRIPQPAGAR